MGNIDKEYEYYKKNKAELLKKYNDKYVAIKNGKVVMHGDDKIELVKKMIAKKHKLGDFLVHLVSRDSDVIYRIHPRIYLERSL